MNLAIMDGTTKGTEADSPNSDTKDDDDDGSDTGILGKGWTMISSTGRCALVIEFVATTSPPGDNTIPAIKMEPGEKFFSTIAETNVVTLCDNSTILLPCNQPCFVSCGSHLLVYDVLAWLHLSSQFYVYCY
jgi:hypothetical protein